MGGGNTTAIGGVGFDGMAGSLTMVDGCVIHEEVASASGVGNVHVGVECLGWSRARILENFWWVMCGI